MLLNNETDSSILKVDTEEENEDIEFILLLSIFNCLLSGVLIFSISFFSFSFYFCFSCQNVLIRSKVLFALLMKSEFFTILFLCAKVSICIK